MMQNITQNDNDKYTVLIVDDEPSNIAVLAQFLAETYEIKVARSAEQAFEILAAGLIPDFILLDVIMPGGMGGIEACRILKKDAKTQHIPIIFITAKDAVNDEITGLEAGAIDYVSKPFNLKLVGHRLRIHLQQAIIKKNLRLNEKTILKHQEALQEADKESRLLLETVGNGIIGVDHLGCINFVNSAASNFLSWPKDELLGKHVYETIFPTPGNKENKPESLVECPLLSPLYTGQVSCREDLVFSSRDGSTLSVEFHSAPLFQGKDITGAVFNFNTIPQLPKSISKMLPVQILPENIH